MAEEIIEINELIGSRVGDDTWARYQYVLVGSNDPATLRQKIRDTAPSTSYNGLPLTNVGLDDQFDDDQWTGYAYYGGRGVNTSTAPTASFSTSGTSQHITHALSTVNSYVPSGKVAADYEGTIAPDDSGKPEGIDIPARDFKFQESHVVPNSGITSYLATLYAKTGTVNNASFTTTKFGSFAAGELLFLGGSGQQRENGDWEITLEFWASPNKTSITIGAITVEEKKGWDYLWIKYRQKDDTTANCIVSIPLQATVVRVFEFVSWSGLLPE